MDDNEQRLCDICKQPFKPEPRSANRQFVCSRPDCQYERKRRYNQAWCAKEINADYFQGRYSHLQEWLKRHPDYLNNYRKQQKNKKSSDVQIQITICNNENLTADNVKVRINANTNNRK